jgi:hypothetical protein
VGALTAQKALKIEKPALAAVLAQQAGGVSPLEAARSAELVEKLRRHMAKIMGQRQIAMYAPL